MAEKAVGDGELIGSRAVEKRVEKVPINCIDDSVDLNRICRFFTDAGWEAVQCVVAMVTKRGVWTCNVCNGDVDSGPSGLSVECDACLERFHGRCDALHRAPRPRNRHGYMHCMS